MKFFLVMLAISIPSFLLGCALAQLLYWLFHPATVVQFLIALAAAA